MKNETEITKALKGETSIVTIYWDKQDHNDVGPAWRDKTDSGALEMMGWAHISGRAVTQDETDGYNIADYFTGPDGAYRGPDSDGIYPRLDA